MRFIKNPTYIISKYKFYFSRVSFLVISTYVLIIVSTILILRSFLFDLFIKFPLAIDSFNFINQYSLEEIKEIKYEHLGYKFFKDSMINFPEKDGYPITRYKDYTKNVHLYLKDFRQGNNPNYIIGIGLDRNDIQEDRIAILRKKNPDLNENTTWLFRTINDIDTLTGFQFFFKENKNNIKKSICFLDLYNTTIIKNASYSKKFEIHLRKNKHVIGIPNGGINDFSFGRGSVDFRIDIRCNPPIEFQSVEARGIKVIIEDYEIVNRNRKSFLAIKKKYISEKRNLKDVKFLNYLEKYKNGN